MTIETTIHAFTATIYYYHTELILQKSSSIFYALRSHCDCWSQLYFHFILHIACRFCPNGFWYILLLFLSLLLLFFLLPYRGDTVFELLENLSCVRIYANRKSIPWTSVELISSWLKVSILLVVCIANAVHVCDDDFYLDCCYRPLPSPFPSHVEYLFLFSYCVHIRTCRMHAQCSITTIGRGDQVHTSTNKSNRNFSSFFSPSLHYFTIFLCDYVSSICMRNLKRKMRISLQTWDFYRSHFSNILLLSRHSYKGNASQ